MTMKVYVLLIVVSVGLVEQGQAKSKDNSNRKKVESYNTKISVLNDLIDQVCSTSSRKKRETTGNSFSHVLQVLEDHYNGLVEELVNCRCKTEVNCSADTTTADITTTTVLSTSTSTSATTTSVGSTTTSSSLAPECLSATNLTESWRTDSAAKDIHGGGPNSQDGYACDFDRRFGWFRFTGAAGNKMMDRCVRFKSCGTRYPYYITADMPQEVGVSTGIRAYTTVADGTCKAGYTDMLVMRCSWNTDYDLIYKYTGYSYRPCDDAFCGMF